MVDGDGGGLASECSRSVCSGGGLHAQGGQKGRKTASESRIARLPSPSDELASGVTTSGVAGSCTGACVTAARASEAWEIDCYYRHRALLMPVTE